MSRILFLMALLTVSLSSFAIPSQQTSTANSQSRIVGYWQNFDNPAKSPVLLSDIPAGYNVVIIAFANLDPAGSGKVSFSLQGPPYTTMSNGLEQFKQDIKLLQARGTKVLISLGGQNGSFNINNDSSEKLFTQSLEDVINELGADGVDYDFENGLTISNAPYLVNATKKIKSDFDAKGKHLIFTNAPETLDVYFQIFPNGKYDPLISAGLLDMVQVQLYNSGCMSAIKPGSPCYSVGSEDFLVSQADSTIQTWKKAGVPNADKLYVLGVPATPGAAGSGYVDPTVVNKALTCLRTASQCGSYVPTETYPGISSVMTWDINWDAKNNYQFVKTVQSCVMNWDC